MSSGQSPVTPPARAVQTESTGDAEGLKNSEEESVRYSCEWTQAGALGINLRPFSGDKEGKQGVFVSLVNDPVLEDKITANSSVITINGTNVTKESMNDVFARIKAALTQAGQNKGKLVIGFKTPTVLGDLSVYMPQSPVSPNVLRFQSPPTRDRSGTTSDLAESCHHSLKKSKADFDALSTEVLVLRNENKKLKSKKAREKEQAIPVDIAWASPGCTEERPVLSSPYHVMAIPQLADSVPSSPVAELTEGGLSPMHAEQVSEVQRVAELQVQAKERSLQEKVEELSLMNSKLEASAKAAEDKMFESGDRAGSKDPAALKQELEAALKMQEEYKMQYDEKLQELAKVNQELVQCQQAQVNAQANQGSPTSATLGGSSAEELLPDMKEEELNRREHGGCFDVSRGCSLW